MNRSQAAIIVAVLAGVVSLVAILVNSGGSGSPVATEPARAVVARVAPAEASSPSLPAPTPAQAVERRPAPALASQAAAEAKPNPVNLPPGTLLHTGLKDTPWELIAPGSLLDTIGPENGIEFQQGMKTTSYPKFRGCAASYRPPEPMKPNGWWEGNVVLDVESSADGYEIVDAIVDRADFADASLESCLRASYKGVRVKVPGLEPGRRYRINHLVAFAFGTKEKMDAP